MTSPAVTYALWPGMGACWCDMADAIAMIKGFVGTFQTGDMSYESALGYAINWLDGVEG